MTEHNRKVAVLLVSILRGNLTVNQLRRTVADSKAQVAKLMPNCVKQSQLDAIAAGEEALARIEREKTKYTRIKNN